MRERWVQSQRQLLEKETEKKKKSTRADDLCVFKGHALSCSIPALSVFTLQKRVCLQNINFERFR